MCIFPMHDMSKKIEIDIHLNSALFGGSVYNFDRKYEKRIKMHFCQSCTLVWMPNVKLGISHNSHVYLHLAFYGIVSHHSLDFF